MPAPSVTRITPESVGEASVRVSRLAHADRRDIHPAARIGEAADELYRLLDLTETLRLAIVCLFDGEEYRVTGPGGMDCQHWPFPARLCGEIGEAIAEVASELSSLDTAVAEMLPETTTGA